MSLRICTSEHMISTATGTGLSLAWLPHVAAERVAQSARDGAVSHAPDPVPLIDTDLTWTNNTGGLVNLHLQLRRASRTIITSNPNTVVLDDALSWDIGTNPNAPLPSVTANGIGSRLKKSPKAFGSTVYARVFADFDDWTTFEHLGAAGPDETVHIRYQCVLTTPGEWRLGDRPLHEAHARWARLSLFVAPLLEVI